MYTNPDVYFKDVQNGANSIEQTSASVGCMLGVTPAGVINQLVKVNSWTEYVNTFANGLESPFMANQDLSYAVYNFYQNGGKELYVGNIRKANGASETQNAKKATITDVDMHLTLTAYAEGDAYNGIKMTLTKSAFFDEGNYEAYDAKIVFGTVAVTLTEVTKDNIVSTINGDLTTKYWVVASATGDIVLSEKTMTLAGGQSGIEALSDTDFINALGLLDDNEEITLVAIPGRTSTSVSDAITSYCDAHRLFPFLDVPSGSTVTEVKEKRRAYASNGGVLCYPWGYINDPSNDGEMRLVPTCGAMMGLYARFISAKGVWVAPAGISATIKGFVKLEKTLTPDESGQLNVAGVVSLISKKNIGIVAWGARGLNNDKSMKYVTDVLLNYTIKRDTYNGTLFTVFQPNTETLWSDVSGIINSYLESLRTQGALKGSSSEAYYVVCDDTNNTDETIENGYLYIDVAYAPVKPAEFVVIRLAHQMNN